MTQPTDWITDRRPTEADGDEDGDVKVRCSPDDDDLPYLHWSQVSEARPWRHCPDWQPRTAPESTKPALAVGQRWRRRDGQVVTIERLDRNHLWGATHPFWASCSSYALNGATNPSGKLGHYQDLIELLPPEPTPTPRKFTSLTRTVADFGHTIDAIDEDGVAWWMTIGSVGSAPEWHQLTPLPAKEAAE